MIKVNQGHAKQEEEEREGGTCVRISVPPNMCQYPGYMQQTAMHFCLHGSAAGWKIQSGSGGKCTASSSYDWT